MKRVGGFLRRDITVLPADDPRKVKIGWVIYEKVGIVVVNDYAINRIGIEGRGARRRGPNGEWIY